MFEETKKGFDWFSLIVGVLFIIAGIASFTRPDKTLHFLAIVAGIAFIFRGIYELWFRQRIGRILGESSGWLIFSAILDIILGIIFLFQPSFGVLFIAIIFAIWFILDSITELISAKFFKVCIPTALSMTENGRSRVKFVISSRGIPPSVASTVLL